ncbi:hypothetical protein Poli38472_003217 [Pythium oligandrum]|uniref:Uncharacterized protein n=1 Tax=Pythium oligandrum TaxID=41045 RepID=A0A8K1C686_PYTOL|nr:hypothetical protein Poli38472_003217 [Pythium oligandrum]|eukprot:TMW57292.1 hypothetical protein Poli38472_003217 [Pythium oligandrum]
MKDVSNIPLTPTEGDYASGDAPEPQRNKRAARFAHLGMGFLLINVIVLYILHFVDRGTPGTSKAVAGELKSGGIATTSLAAQQGFAVSFNADGQLRVGAGSTVYLDAADKLPSDATSYIRFARLQSNSLSNTNLMSYQTGTAPDIVSTVTTVVADVDAKTVAISAADSKNAIKGGSIKDLATLSDKTAVVLHTVSSDGGMTITPYVTPASIADGKVTLDQEQTKVAANSSATNFITRLSDSEFAMVFYEPYSEDSEYFQRVQVGTVKDGKIAFSKSLQFGDANSATGGMTTVGQPISVFNTSDHFTVPWFTEGSEGGNSSASLGLCLTTFLHDVKNSNFTSESKLCQSSYRPAYFVDATKLADNVVAFAFLDSANNYALTIAAVEYSEITRKPTFRGSYVFTEATGKIDFGASFGFYPKPTVRVLADNHLAVGFFNPSNKAKPSVKVLKFSSDLSFQAVSPALPLANADYTVVSADPMAGGSIVMDIVPVASGFVVAFSGSWIGTQHQRVSYVEAYGAPVGVVSDKSGNDLNVAMSGTVDVDTSLTTGRAYYAATNGKIYEPSAASTDAYVLANDYKLVISKDALVGVAVSDSKLFVSNRAN